MVKTVLAVFAAALSAFAANAVYDIDVAHSSAQFQVRHMMVTNVRGEFAKMSGTVEYDPANPSAAKVEATIDATTINTRDQKRDAHLRSADFFDVEKFPAIKFVSKQVAPNGTGKLKVTGDLTMHGVTREVVLDVEGPTSEVKDARGNIKMGAAATTKVNRKDFGVTWNRALDGGGVVVGDEVTINLDVELNKRK
jgi:polyisoprenoid-binding protein YceI